MSDDEKRNDTMPAPAVAVNPAENPGPRGNATIDPERADRTREDYERAGAN